MKWSKSRLPGSITNVAATNGRMGKISAQGSDERQRKQPGNVKQGDGRMAPGENPGLGAEDLGQREKAHAEHEGHEAGKPELLDAVGHGVFLSSSGLNFTAQI